MFHSDSLTAFTNLMTSASVNSSSLVLMFSMMASGQDELINSALVYMAIHLERTWFVFCYFIFHTDGNLYGKLKKSLFLDI